MKESSDNREFPEERQWECGWAEHEARQRRRLSRPPLSEKLRWLEQAQRMVVYMQASRSAPEKDAGSNSH
jgi:hypothetical protein